MNVSLTELIHTTLAQFSTATRLYALSVGDGTLELGSGVLLVEAFAAEDAVQGVGPRDVIVLSTDAHLDLRQLLGEQASLQVSLADGTRTSFCGNIGEAAMLGSEGGLARFRLRLTPWIWRLSQVRNSRVWQDKTVIEIVDAVFGAYLPLAIWRWSDETGPFMQGALARSYCCQYRESDLDFVQRLLAEEGLAWRFEQTAEGLGAVLFADSTQLSAVPEDPSSQADGGIRFHNVRAGERQDTVQALTAQRTLRASLTTVLSYDYKAKRAVGASVPSRLEDTPRLPVLESFDTPGQYAYANAAQAQRYAGLQMESKEARSHIWRGRSTLRTLRAGTRLTILDAPLRSLGDSPAFTVLRVASVGFNNLPAPAQQALAELFGPIPELLEEMAPASAPEDFALVIAQARKNGYANSFEAIAADVPWRPQLAGSEGRSHPRPTALGSQTAIVVARTAATASTAPMNCTATSSAACAFDSIGRTAATPAAGCALRSVRPAAGWAASSCPASAWKCSSSFWKTTSTGPSSSAPCTTARAKAALRPPRLGCKVATAAKHASRRRMTTPLRHKAMSLVAIARCGMALQATARATATALRSGACAARSLADRAITSCCSTIPTHKAESSCEAVTRDRNSISGT